MTNEPDTKQRMKSLKVYVDEHAKALGVSSTEAAILLGVAIMWAFWHNSRDRLEVKPPEVKRDPNKPWR